VRVAIAPRQNTKGLTHPDASLSLGHSEDLSQLERAVQLAEELVERAPPKFRKILEHSASQARGHRDVIARFGRHPHRNAVLGRQTSPEELEYVVRGQFVHTHKAQTVTRGYPMPDDQTLARIFLAAAVDFDGLQTTNR
jgi:hypothetical protein